MCSFSLIHRWFWCYEYCNIERSLDFCNKIFRILICVLNVILMDLFAAIVLAAVYEFYRIFKFSENFFILVIYNHGNTYSLKFWHNSLLVFLFLKFFKFWNHPYTIYNKYEFNYTKTRNNLTSTPWNLYVPYLNCISLPRSSAWLVLSYLSLWFSLVLLYC
jgi:hypothetical protein